MNPNLRIGHGFDVHAFTAGDHVVIGGVRIAHGAGLKAHSDGDVLIHALCDALLGAAALGDIGRHFPDTDAAWKGADSRLLLRETVAMVAGRSYRLVNADCTVIAQAPKMAPHIDEMCARLAADMGVETGRVNIKATTSEGLGYTGRGEGMAAHAVVLLTATDG